MRKPQHVPTVVTMQNDHLIRDWREAWKAEADENARLRGAIDKAVRTIEAASSWGDLADALGILQAALIDGSVA